MKGEERRRERERVHEFTSPCSKGPRKQTGSLKWESVQGQQDNKLWGQVPQTFNSDSTTYLVRPWRNRLMSSKSFVCLWSRLTLVHRCIQDKHWPCPCSSSSRSQACCSDFKLHTSWEKGTCLFISMKQHLSQYLTYGKYLLLRISIILTIVKLFITWNLFVVRKNKLHVCHFKNSF